MSAPSMYIFPNKVSIVGKNQYKIENRQYLVNMKDIGIVVLTEPAITCSLPESRYSLYCSIEKGYFNFMQSN